MKQGLSDRRIIKPLGEVEFDSDTAFIANYNAYKFSGFGRDFQQHSIFLLRLLRLKAG